MPAYRIHAYTADSRPLKFVIQAIDRDTAEAQVKERGLFPSRIRESRSMFTKPERIKLTSAELVELFTHLELQLSAGIKAIVAIGVLKERLPSKRLRLLLNEVYEHLLSARGNLTSALRRHPRTFPPEILTVINAGENTGTLSQAFSEQRESIEFTREVRGAISRALQYPALLVIVGLGLLTYFMAYTVPAFTKVLKEMNVEMYPITKAVIAVGNWSLHYWPLIPIALVTVLGGYNGLRRLPAAGVKIDALMLRLPLYGDIIRQLSAALFCRTYRSLYLAKFNALQALDMCASLLLNKELSARLRRARRMVHDGASLESAFHTTEALPPEACAIIGSGEASGNLAEALQRIATFHATTAKDRIRKATNLLGPIVIIIMGIIIGTVVLAMILPIIKLSSSIQ